MLGHVGQIGHRPNLHGTLHASRSPKRWNEQEKEKEKKLQRCEVREAACASEVARPLTRGIVSHLGCLFEKLRLEEERIHFEGLPKRFPAKFCKASQLLLKYPAHVR